MPIKVFLSQDFLCHV